MGVPGESGLERGGWRGKPAILAYLINRTNGVKGEVAVSRQKFIPDLQRL